VATFFRVGLTGAPGGAFATAAGSRATIVAPGTSPLFAAGHEFLHHLKLVAPAGYDALIRDLSAYMGKEESAELEKVRKIYDGTSTDAEEEYWCNRFGELLQDPERLRRFSLEMEMKNAGMARRILIRIREYIRSILDAMGGKDTLQERRLKRADEMVGKILDNLERGEITPSNGSDGVKYMIQNIEGFGDTPVVTIGEFLPKSVVSNESGLEQWIKANIVNPLNSYDNVELNANASHLARSDYAQRANQREKIARGRAIGILKDIVSLVKIDDEHLARNKHGKNNRIWKNKITFALPQFDKGKVCGAIAYDAILVAKEIGDKKYAYDITDIQENKKLSEGLRRDMSVFERLSLPASAGGYPAESPQRVSADNVTPGGDSVNNAVKDSVTPQQDADYMDAVKRGDMDKAQRMVNDRIKELGGVFHRGKSPRNTLFIVEWADDPEAIVSYGDNQYAHLPSQLTEIPKWVYDFAREYYTNEGYGDEAIEDGVNPKDIVDSAGVWDDPDFVSSLWSAHEDELIDMADNGIVGFKTIDGAVSFPQGKDGNCFKIADPVTYDDNGNVIPLSKRFNPADNDIRYSVTDSDNFRKWFGDSKVVDGNGEPLVVYRGEKRDLLSEEPGKAVTKPVSYFTGNPEYARRYGKVNAYYLRMEHPLDVRNPEDARRLSEFYPDGYSFATGKTGALDWAEMVYLSCARSESFGVAWLSFRPGPPGRAARGIWFSQSFPGAFASGTRLAPLSVARFGYGLAPGVFCGKSGGWAA